MPLSSNNRAILPHKKLFRLLNVSYNPMLVIHFILICLYDGIYGIYEAEIA